MQQLSNDNLSCYIVGVCVVSTDRNSNADADDDADIDGEDADADAGSNTTSQCTIVPWTTL